VLSLSKAASASLPVLLGLNSVGCCMQQVSHPSPTNSCDFCSGYSGKLDEPDDPMAIGSSGCHCSSSSMGTSSCSFLCAAHAAWLIIAEQSSADLLAASSTAAAEATAAAAVTLQSLGFNRLSSVGVCTAPPIITAHADPLSSNNRASPALQQLQFRNCPSPGRSIQHALRVNPALLVVH